MLSNINFNELKNHIKERLDNKTNRNRISSLLKEVDSIPIFNQTKNSLFTNKQNIYHFYNNITYIPLCKVCNKETNWSEKDFKYTITCSYKCSGKLEKTATKIKSDIVIESKKILKKLLSTNKIRSTSIDEINYKNYNEILKEPGITIQEKIYRHCHISNIDNVCKNNNCNEPTKFINFSSGYRLYCSIKCSSGSDTKKENIINTTNIVYGCNNISQNKKINSKIKNTKKLKYFKNYSDKTPESYKLLDIKYPIFLLKHLVCNNLFESNYDIFRNRLSYNTELCTICNPIGQYIYNAKENELYNFIESIIEDTKILRKDRNVISPKELDIYLPDHKIAFEFNGKYWHSNLFVSDTYHLNKSLMCSKQDIDLIHIYESDWDNPIKKNILKSIIVKKLKRSEKDISEYSFSYLDLDIVDEFLNSNHLRGGLDDYTGFNIKGLYLNMELISVMIFSIIENNVYIVKFCDCLNNDINTYKLFHHMIKSIGSVYGYVYDCDYNINEFSEIENFIDGRSFDYKFHLNKPNILLDTTRYKIYGSGYKTLIIKKV